jgi:deoxyribonuclease-4
MNVGAHVRGGGKLIPSLEYGEEIGATSIQVFTQSPRMWKPSQYAPEVLKAYREAEAQHPTITDTFCHATYLINLATGESDLYEKSVECLTHNLSVARGMGSSGLVLHVGSHKGAGFDSVVRQIADAFERALAEADPAPDGIPSCPILIENAAGSDGPVGRTFEEIGLLIDACNGDDRLGLCIDTQHLWASGFDYSTVEGTERLVNEVERTVGMQRLRCFHFNDSKIELGGNRDRHANIGEGTIGEKGLAPLVGHPRIRDLPLLLEVPGDGDGPRAVDVAIGKRVVDAGIALYDGDPHWDSLLIAAIVAPSSASPKKVATKKKAAKKAAPAKKTVTKKKAAPVKKTAVKKATKKAAKKAAPAKKFSSTKKKAAKKAAPAKKTVAKKKAAPVKKVAVKKAAVKKAPVKKTAAKKATKKALPIKKTAKKSTKKSTKKK